MGEVSLVKLSSGECRWTILIMSQHWFRQQAIAWANVDPGLCHHMASLGCSELIKPQKENAGRDFFFIKIGDSADFQLVSEVLFPYLFFVLACWTHGLGTPVNLESGHHQLVIYSSSNHYHDYLNQWWLIHWALLRDCRVTWLFRHFPSAWKFRHFLNKQKINQK